MSHRVCGPTGYAVGMFFSLFNLQDSEACLLDSLSIYDGAITDAARKLYSGYGTEVEDSLWSRVSHSNQVLFSFTSDDSTTKDGFVLNWKCLSSSLTTFDYYISVDGVVECSSGSVCGSKTSPLQLLVAGCDSSNDRHT